MTKQSITAPLLASIVSLAACSSRDEVRVKKVPDGIHDAGGTSEATPTEASEATPSEAAEAAPIPGPGEGASCVRLPQTCGPDRNENCCAAQLVPGGTFYRSYDGVSYTDQSYPATISDFRLDKYEITTGRYYEFLAAWNTGWRPSAGAGKHTHLNDGNGLANSADAGNESGWDAGWEGMVSATSVSGQSGWATGTGPIRLINWYEAYAFCIWDGGFLPSEAEWNYAAAGGSEQRVYAWSTPPNSTLFDAEHLVVCYVDNGIPADGCNPQPVGSRPMGNGKWGHADLIGNMPEWVLDGLPEGAFDQWAYAQGFVYPYVADCTDCSYLPTTSAFRVLRGGGYFVAGPDLSSSYRNLFDAADRSGDLGARCARPPI